MDISKFNELPDTLSVETLEAFFNEVIDAYASKKDNVSNIEFSEAIYQLSERQWNTYKILDEKLNTK
ncbi:hypothetical protein [Bacillus halotolerans]|uniref:hypothetical protein n=1 Tax=Bacillus halotolerans TaxID=260554 RepID=UPI003F6D97A8